MHKALAEVHAEVCKWLCCHEPSLVVTKGTGHISVLTVLCDSSCYVFYPGPTPSLLRGAPPTTWARTSLECLTSPLRTLTRVRNATRTRTPGASPHAPLES